MAPAERYSSSSIKNRLRSQSRNARSSANILFCASFHQAGERCLQVRRLKDVYRNFPHYKPSYLLYHTGPNLHTGSNLIP